jgi:hypothetical protein
MHFPSCDCGSQKEVKQAECCRTVLECNPPKREKFSITQLSAEDSTNLSSWNIALFGHPRHPDLDHVETFKGVKWLSLDGQTPQERVELQDCLRIISRIRDKQQKTYATSSARVTGANIKSVIRSIKSKPCFGLVKVWLFVAALHMGMSASIVNIAP